MKIEKYKLDVAHYEALKTSVMYFVVDGDTEAVKAIAQKIEMIIKEINS